jgi:hypothetical protein
MHFVFNTSFVGECGMQAPILEFLCVALWLNCGFQNDYRVSQHVGR